MQAEAISFSGAGVRLSGSLWVPDRRSDGPGVLLIGGSGPSDRHNGGLFDELSEHLVARGIAVLAYDKRGAGSSTGSWADAGVDELAADARRALEVLRAHPRVDADAVGVFGHSEGGWVALRLGVQQPALARLVVNSCPAVALIDAEVFALTRVGLAPVDAVAAGNLLRSLTACARGGNQLDRAQDLVASARKEPWFGMLEDGGLALDGGGWAQIRAWGDYDPYDDLKRLTVPTLVLLGADDALVPVSDSTSIYAQTAIDAARQQEIAVFPHADHRLRTAEGEFAAGYLTRLSDWISSLDAARSVAARSTVR